MSHLLFKRFLKGKRGFSTVIASIFMVLAVLFLFFNVFMFMQNQDIKLQDAISQSQQLDNDHNAEHLQIENPTLSPETGVVSVTLTNDCSLPIKINRAWLIETSTINLAYNVAFSKVLSPYETLNEEITFTAINPSGHYRLELVTSRGNLFSILLSS